MCAYVAGMLCIVSVSLNGSVLQIISCNRAFFLKGLMIMFWGQFRDLFYTFLFEKSMFLGLAEEDLSCLKYCKDNGSHKIWHLFANVLSTVGLSLYLQSVKDF